MNPRRSKQHVALRSSNMDLILYAAVVPLFAILLVYQVYASSSTPFVDTIHNHSVLVILSPVKLRPIVSHVLESILSLSSRATSFQLPSASKLLGSCLSILTRESLDKFVSTAHWATDKLFTYEIPYMITIAITSFFTKFFHLTYLRDFISTASLLVTYASNLSHPQDHNSLRAARQQFKHKICAFCCVIFVVIDYTTSTLVTVSTLRCAVRGCWGPEGINYCGTWLVINYIAAGIATVVVGFSAVGLFIWMGAKNILESWQFVEAAREKEATRFGFEDDAMERAANAMKQSGRFTEDEKEGRVKEGVLREIIRLYEADETQVDNAR